MKNLSDFLSGLFFKPSSAEISAVFMQLAVLLDSGVSISESINALKSPNKMLQNALQNIAQNLKNGVALDVAFSKHLGIFTPLVPSLIAVGQGSGNLAKIFEMLQIYFDDSARLGAKIKKALFYPLLVLFSICCAFLSIIYFVLPPFISLFAQLGLQLPIYTQIMLACYDFLISFDLTIFLCFALIIFGVIFVFYRVENLKFFVDSVLLKLPIFGQLFLTKDSYVFCFSLYCAVSGAVSIDNAVKLASNNVQNLALRRKFERLSLLIHNSISLSTALKDLQLLDDISITLISAGERSGKLSLMLEKSAKNIKNNLDLKTDFLLKLIEPFLTILMGLFILFLALGIFLPMWEINGNIL